VSVDVETEIAVDRPVEVVSGDSADPSNAQEWYANSSRTTPHDRQLPEDTRPRVAAVAATVETKPKRYPYNRRGWRQL
jgi:hypothetical protein